MALSTDDSPTGNAAPAPAFAIPNFREEERIQTRYASMLARRIKDFYAEHEASISRNASAKRDELKDELDAANAEWEHRKAVAEAARESYRAVYPQHVKKTRLIEPSTFENMKSLGKATKLYHTAEEAWRAAEHAAGDIRRIEHNEEQLDIELQKAHERAPQVSKEVTESEKWLAEIHADEEMGATKAKVDEIVAEREAYAERLAAGRVTPDELRLRAFALEDIKPIKLPIDGMLFWRIDTFGTRAYFIIRDIGKKLWALPYDRRLERLVGSVTDIVRQGKEFEVRRTTRPNSQIPMSVLDHFQKWESDDIKAREAYAEHQAFQKASRTIAAPKDIDDTETLAIDVLAAYAEKLV